MVTKSVIVATIQTSKDQVTGSMFPNSKSWIGQVLQPNLSELRKSLPLRLKIIIHVTIQNFKLWHTIYISSQAFSLVWYTSSQATLAQNKISSTKCKRFLRNKVHKGYKCLVSHHSLESPWREIVDVRIIIMLYHLLGLSLDRFARAPTILARSGVSVTAM